MARNMEDSGGEQEGMRVKHNGTCGRMYHNETY